MIDKTNWLEPFKILFEDIASHYKGEELYKAVKEVLDVTRIELSPDQFRRLKEYALSEGYIKEYNE